MYYLIVLKVGILTLLSLEALGETLQFLAIFIFWRLPVFLGSWPPPPSKLAVAIRVFLTLRQSGTASFAPRYHFLGPS